MSGNFAKLLRTSRFASFDPELPQILTTRAEDRARGHWGLKRTLPRKIQTKYIKVDAMDTREQITSFEESDKQVERIDRWKSIFPVSNAPTPPSTKIDISKLSDEEWKAFLTNAAKRKKEYKEFVTKNQIIERRLHEFFDYEVIQGAIRKYPTYHNYKPLKAELKVKGRILSRHGGESSSVGILGFVANLPFGGRRFNVRSMEEFLVEEACFDENMQPIISLSRSEFLSTRTLPFKPPSAPQNDDATLQAIFNNLQAKDQKYNVEAKKEDDASEELLNALLLLAKPTNTKKK